MRVHIQQDRNRVVNRIARLLETVNIKLASVASNIVGKSGMAMLRLLASGVRDPEQLAEHALSSLRSKIPELILALDGRPDAHFRWMLSELLRKLDRLDEELAHVDVQIAEVALPYADVLRRLATIPGVDTTTALVLLAEFGTDMQQFPTPGHLASWAGLCPGNAESAGKRFSGRTRKGDRYVRRILVQSAWAAARTSHIKQLVEFYRRVLVLEPRTLTDEYAEFATGVGVLALFSAKAQENYIPGSVQTGKNKSLILEFRVTNVDSEYERLQGIVKTWVKGPTTQPWGDTFHLLPRSGRQSR